MNERDREKGEPTARAPEEEMLSRRKLVYAAPLLMSKRLFYRASGCLKHSGQGGICSGSGAKGS
jgi:hypothetical protein